MLSCLVIVSWRPVFSEEEGLGSGSGGEMRLLGVWVWSGVKVKETVFKMYERIAYFQ